MPVYLVPTSTGATGDLITVARAQQNAALAKLEAAAPGTLAPYITAASRAVERYCHRQFATQDYSELYDGPGQPYEEIQLSNFPVTQVARLATSPLDALKINNNNTAYQRATVSVTSTGLSLSTVNSGANGTSSVAFSANITIAAVASAINMLGNGWQATVTNNLGGYASTDLVPQGSYSARSGATLRIYTEDQLISPAGWSLRADLGILTGLWSHGVANIRIDYTAGFDPVPADVQQAVVMYVQGLYTASTNVGIKSSSLGPYSATFDPSVGNGITGGIAALLASYVDHAKVIYRQGA